MSKFLAALGLSTALAAAATLPLATQAQAALSYGGQGVADLEHQMTPVEKAQYFWDGYNWCWYPVGWHGPGWYWCGYAWNNGYGWGGGWWWWRHRHHHVPTSGQRPGHNWKPMTGASTHHFIPMTGAPTRHFIPMTGARTRHFVPMTGAPTHHFMPMTGGNMPMTGGLEGHGPVGGGATWTSRH